MKKKHIPHSPRLVEFKKKRQAVIRRRVILCALVLAAILVGLSSLAGWKRINISDVVVVGNKIIDTEIVQAAVHKNLEGKYLWFIPKTNFLFYPKAAIVDDLTTTFRRFKDISVNITSANVLEIKVSERAALYTWCGKDRMELTENDTPCYFLDQSGYVLDTAPYFSGDVYFRFYGEVDLTNEEKETGTLSPLGGYFFKEYFNKLTAFKEATIKMGLQPVGIYVGEEGNDITMYLEKGKNPRMPAVYLRGTSDFEKIAGNLQTALDTDPLKTKFKKNYQRLEYIDLRFGNKVYYKFTGDIVPAVPTP